MANHPATLVTMGNDRFGENRSLGVSVSEIAFKVAGQGEEIIHLRPMELLGPPLKLS